MFIYAHGIACAFARSGERDSRSKQTSVCTRCRKPFGIASHSGFIQHSHSVKVEHTLFVTYRGRDHHHHVHTSFRETPTPFLPETLAPGLAPGHAMGQPWDNIPTMQVWNVGEPPQDRPRTEPLKSGHCGLARRYPKSVDDTMSDDEAACAPCGDDATEGVPAGWRCVNCGEETASKRRGPNKEFCSKGPCRRLASMASAEAKDDVSQRRISALEAQVRDQATTIALLRKELTQAQAALERASSVKATAKTSASKPVAPQPTAKPTAARAQPRTTTHTDNAAIMALLQSASTSAPGKAASAAATPAASVPRAGERRPLTALQVNGATAEAAAPGKKAKRTEPAPKPVPKPMPWWKRGVLCPGWTHRPSNKRPGESTWIHEELGVALAEPPRVRTDDGDGWCVQYAVIRSLMQGFLLENGRLISRKQLYADFEVAMGLEAGTVAGSIELKKLVNDESEAASESLGQRWEEDKNALYAWLQAAEDKTGRGLLDAVGALGWDTRRVRACAHLLEDDGDIYSTIDAEHFAITPPEPEGASM